MSLETLLEAAEFLESREQGSNIKEYRQHAYEKVKSETGSSTDGSESNGPVVKIGKEPRTRTKSGSQKDADLPFESSAEGFYMRKGTREVHNKLEKNRRAHLKECFDFLKKNIPSLEEKRTSNLGILRSSLRYIQNLKRKEIEFELEMHKFVHQKIVLQEKITQLKAELNKMNIDVDINAITAAQDQDNETNSTSTATERGTPPPSDHDENDDDEEEAEKLALETNSPTPVSGQKRKHLDKKEEKSPKRQKNYMFMDFKLPPKKALVQNMNGLKKSTHLPSPQPVTVSSESPKKIPVFPIAVSLQGPVGTQALTMLSPLPPPTGLDMTIAGKLMELQQKPRPPVTQILHQTLTQRQALQKQTNTTASIVTSAPLTAAQLKSPPLSQPAALVTMTTQSALSSLVVKDGMIGVAKTTSATNTAIKQQQLTTVTATGPATMTFPYYYGSLQKFAHPVLVTSLMTPALGLQASTVGNSAGSVTVSNSVGGSATLSVPTSALLTPKSDTIKSLETSKSSVIQTNISTTTHSNLVTLSLASTALKSVPSVTPSATVAGTSTVPIRQVFAPGLIPGQLAWPLLTLPRSPVIVPTSTIIPTTSLASSQAPASVSMVTSTAGQVTSHPLVSLANLNQLTQMMTPMTVMSPGIQVNPTALTQAQLNGMFAAPLIKQLQLPLGTCISTSLLQSGQVLGQQVMKPVVVMTVPSVVSTASSLPSNTASVTSSL